MPGPTLDPVDAQAAGVGRAAARYALLRLALFGVLLVGLHVTGLRGLFAVAAALFVSSVLSLFVLRRQRDALTAALTVRADRRDRERARLRGLLDDG